MAKQLFDARTKSTWLKRARTTFIRKIYQRYRNNVVK